MTAKDGGGRRPQVESELSDLGSGLDQLEKGLVGLQDRIGSVLRIPDPEEPPNCDKMAVVERCPLAERLHDANGRLVHLLTLLNKVTERIEL